MIKERKPLKTVKQNVSFCDILEMLDNDCFCDYGFCQSTLMAGISESHQGGIMKKISALVLVAMLTALSFAGDAAFFIDEGFSSDGSVYIFAQYGQTDKNYRGWAEIYTVDVRKNIYVPGEVYITNPSTATSNKSGKEIYTTLSSINSKNILRYKCVPANAEQTLFISGDDSKPGTEEIIFKDFGDTIGAQSTYSVKMIPTVSGSGKNVSSSFFIMLEKCDSAGNVLGRQKIGTPEIKRKGVSDYKIQRIVCDKTGSNIIFIVEKTVHDDSGVLIRYMVEAAALDAPLHVAVK